MTTSATCSNRRQQLSLTDPDALAVTRNAYDELNRLKASLSAEGYLKIFDYDAVGRQIRLTEFDDRFAPTADGRRADLRQRSEPGHPGQLRRQRTADHRNEPARRA